jgi:hypothetical protein
MTQNEIIEMAEQAGVAFSSDDYPDIWGVHMHVGKQEIETFAKLVAAKAFQNGYEKGIAAFNEAVLIEREACAKVCDEFCYGSTKILIERAIRARGEA